MPTSCLFCHIVNGDEPASVVRRWDDAIAITPPQPIAVGHILVLPIVHVADFLEIPEVSAAVMRHAAEIAEPPCSLITSSEGLDFCSHFHVRLVPRQPDDCLRLWHPDNARTF